MKQTLRYTLWAIAAIIFVIGIVFAIWVVFFLNEHYVVAPKGINPDMSLSGDIGDFIGGVIGTIFSFVATTFVGLTLWEQGRQNARNLFVQSYYEMLRVHANHVEQLLLSNGDGESHSGRSVFPQLIKHYNTIYDSISRFVKNILNGGLFGNSDESAIVTLLCDDHKRLSLIMRIAYSFFFYGSDNYRPIESTDEAEKKAEKAIIQIAKDSQFYTKGHHVVLGHYYRHMFQMLYYVIHSDCINENERYTYAKQLRAQLDDNEQLLLYYNAMADVGKAWLIAPDSNSKIKRWWIEKSGKRRPDQMCPMARFRMIRNIPVSVTVKGIDPVDMFKEEIKYYTEEGTPFFEQNRKPEQKS